MGKFNSPLLGKVRNSVGGSTMSTWKGINVIKSKAESVANPRTAGQVAQRNKMKVIVELFRSFAGLINIGFREMAIQMSAFNAFASENLTNGALVVNAGVVSINPELLAISKGTISKTQLNNAVWTLGTKTLAADFLVPLNAGQKATDKIGVVMWDGNGVMIGWALPNVVRNAGNANIVINNFKDGAVAAYVSTFFYSVEDKKVEDFASFPL